MFKNSDFINIVKNFEQNYRRVFEQAKVRILSCHYIQSATLFSIRSNGKKEKYMLRLSMKSVKKRKLNENSVDFDCRSQ